MPRATTANTRRHNKNALWGATFDAILIRDAAWRRGIQVSRGRDIDA